ncbi:TetR/AcrR family transcriptional regulator [Megalodesulfovibrio paquesii]
MQPLSDPHSPDSSEEKSCGRPRCLEARAAILAATLELISEQGLCSLTMEAIARRAGAGKQTIYRWWPSKADVVLEAMAERMGREALAADHGSLAADLEAFLLQAAEDAAAWSAPHLRCLMVEAQRDEAFRLRFLEKHLAVRQEAARALFARAVQRGELPAQTARQPSAIGEEACCARDTVDRAIELLFGLLWFRLLTARPPLDPAQAAAYARMLARSAGWGTADSPPEI